MGNLNPERPIIFLLGTGSVFNAAVVFSEMTIGIVVAGAAMVSIFSGAGSSFGVFALIVAAGVSFCSAIFFLPPTLL